MPTIGGFHAMYWKHRANPAIAAGTKTGWMYPGMQSVVTCGMAIWGVSFDVVKPVWRQLRWYLVLAKRLWWWRSPESQDRLETWIGRLETFSADERAVLERVVGLMDTPLWMAACTAVRECANTPKFHRPEAWVEYSRAIRENPGQAQNVFRHLKAVQAVRGLSDEPNAVSNPDAHLVIELAYQAFAATPRRLTVVSHPVLSLVPARDSTHPSSHHGRKVQRMFLPG